MSDSTHEGNGNGAPQDSQSSVPYGSPEEKPHSVVPENHEPNGDSKIEGDDAASPSAAGSGGGAGLAASQGSDPPTARQISIFQQFLALQKKNFAQKLRTPIGTCLEIILPVLFIVGLVGAWSAVDLNIIQSQHFVSPLDTQEYNPLVTRSFLCNNQTWNPIPGIQFCNRSDPTLFCRETGFLPVDGLCVQNYNVARQWVQQQTFVWSDARKIPSLDDIIALRWLGRLIVGEYFANSPATYLQPDNSLAFGSYLHFVGDPVQTPRLIDYLNRTTPLFKYVFGKLHKDMDTAVDSLLQEDNYGKVWSLVTLAEVTPEKFVAALRFNRTAIPWTTFYREYYKTGLGPAWFRNYWAGGYTSLQLTLQDFYLRGYHNLTVNPTPPVSLAVMPLTPYRDSIFLIVAGVLCPLVLVLAYLYSVSQLVKRMVEEKEKRLREAMMIMGLHKVAFYFSWIITYMIQMLISTIIITIILKATILQQSDGSVIFVLFLLFSFSTVTFGSFLSSLFSKSRTAAVISPLLFFATAIPTFATAPDQQTRSTLLGLSILPADAFGVGCGLAFNYEVTRGIGWKDAWSEADKAKLGEALIFLSADIIFYFLLGIYLDAVLPSEWGTRRHPLFCLLFWKKDEEPEIVDVNETELANSKLREKSSHEVEASVRIRGLLKEFDADGKKKAAVNKISLDIFPNEVTVLLGHNGAGKTTTINMLTGMLPVSGGNCEVYGKSILTQMPDIRSDIGFCPQHNILWDDLTVREHLKFYATIKGRTGAEADKAADEMIEACDLGHFTDALAGNLSGGNKRKLSIGNSFVGGARLVFLDEPSAGMDVVARRHTWGLIRRMTKGRTILLTTHFMDEADLLGNHIAIMNHGEIYCSGSPLYLKSQLGVGYSLNIALESSANVDNLFAVITNIIPEAEVLSAKGGELSVRLPMQCVEAFPALLERLENDGAALGARSFGISITTLEEVFLRISDMEKEELESLQPGAPPSEAPAAVAAEVDDGNGATVAVAVTPSRNPMSSPHGHGSPSLAGSQSERLWPDGCDPHCEISNGRQFRSLMMKRFHNSKRDRRTQCFQIVTPLLCILLAMILGQWKTQPTPARTMDADLYEENRLEITTSSACGSMFLDRKWQETKPPVPTPNAYNFSKWLLTSADNHSLIRDVSVHCGGTYGTTVFMNASGWHTAAIGTGVVAQHEARKALSNPNIQMKTYNWLLPFTPREADFLDSYIAIIIGFFILIPFTFIPSTFVSYVVKERETRAKHLQLVSGVHYVAYWSSNFLFDLVSFILTELLMIILMLIFNRSEYIGAGDVFGAMLLLFLLYGLSGVAASYLISFAFDSHGTASNVVMLINFIAGFLIVMLLYILQILESTKDAAKVLKYFARILPSYCLGEGIISLATLPLRKVAKEADTNPFSMDVGVGWSLIYMAIELPVFLFFTMLLDHPSRELRRQQLFHQPDVKPPLPADEDPDVAEERHLVESGSRDGQDLVSMRNLCKKYPIPGGEKLAVKNLSFGVKKGEIFAFLGTNGAGKTTTMGILTGEFLPTHGHGFVAGFDVVRDRAEARKQIGFCPQFDALNELLTPEEHLELYAALRGVNVTATPTVVRHLLDICDLEPYKNIPSHQLSGGNKRKLSLAIALIGSPQVLFLDEPSAGMDPRSRRKLWTVIQRAAAGCSVVLTTHHLEEIEVLGDRVAIMVAGELRCIGSLQHLKSKFGSGFEMMIKVRRIDDLEALHQFIRETFPQAHLTEEKQERVTYGLPREGTRLSQLFKVLGANKDRLNITDYSLSQTSLELVFLKISQEAEEEENANLASPSAKH